MTACNWIAYSPADQVAALAAPLLEGLRAAYLAGASEDELFAAVVSRGLVGGESWELRPVVDGLRCCAGAHTERR